VRLDHAPITDLRGALDDGMWADLDIGAEAGGGVNDGAWVNHDLMRSTKYTKGTKKGGEILRFLTWMASPSFRAFRVFRGPFKTGEFR
jgi:hypothetical protein